MLLYYIPLTMTTLFCTTSPSFILPAARCVFDLTPIEEGLLFGAVYVGQFLQPQYNNNELLRKQLNKY